MVRSSIANFNSGTEATPDLLRNVLYPAVPTSNVQVVEDSQGRRGIVRKLSGETILISDFETGETRYVSVESVRFLDGTAPLIAAAKHANSAENDLDARSNGLLVLIQHDEPVLVRTILELTTLCESDLFALLRGLESAGYIERIDIADERGYRLTAAAHEAISKPENIED